MKTNRASFVVKFICIKLMKNECVMMVRVRIVGKSGVS